MCCEFTPLYSGIRVPNGKYGGLLFNNATFGCNYKELDQMCDQVAMVRVPPSMNNYLELSLAASSAAFGVEALKLSSPQ